jgi:hypothetical protein
MGGEFKINEQSDMTPEQIARAIGWELRRQNHAEPSTRPWGIYIAIALLAVSTIAQIAYYLRH